MHERKAEIHERLKLKEGGIRGGTFDLRRRWFFPAAGLAFTGLLALSEPSRMLGLTLSERIALSALNVFMPLMLALMISHLVMASQAARMLPYWLWLALIGVLATVVSVPAFVAMEAWLAPLDIDGGPPLLHSTLETFLPSWPGEAWQSTRVIVPTWLLLNLAVHWSRTDRSPAMGGAHDATRRSGFLTRLPKRLGNDIVWVSAEQHYVRVVTPLGTDLLLCGFGRAAHELTAQDRAGMAVHRSHWVAWDHVVEIRVVEGEAFCLLTTANLVPISRRRVREAREAFDAYRSPAERMVVRRQHP